MALHIASKSEVRNTIECTRRHISYHALTSCDIGELYTQRTCCACSQAGLPGLVPKPGQLLLKTGPVAFRGKWRSKSHSRGPTLIKIVFRGVVAFVSARISSIKVFNH